eukprot:11997490-Ditylum_brightwellii.AAC.1
MSQQVFQSQLALFQVQMLELKPSVPFGSKDDGPGCVLEKGVTAREYCIFGSQIFRYKRRAFLDEIVECFRR